MTNHKLKVVSPRPEHTLRETRRQLRWEWMRRNLNIEIASAQASRVVDDADERKMQYYSLSSNNRRTFMMLVIRAALEDTKLVVSDLTYELGVSRNTVETMVRECRENGWLEVEKDGKGYKHVWAADCLVKCYYNYSKWLYQTISNLEIRKVSEDIARVDLLYKQMEQGGLNAN